MPIRYRYHFSRVLLAGSALLLGGVATLSAQPYRDPDESKFKILPVESLNSERDDYGPFITANGRWLYLTSSRDGASDLYRAPRDADGWGTPQRVPTPESTQGLLGGSVPPGAQLHEMTPELAQRTPVPEFGLVTRSVRRGRRMDADLYGVRIAKDGATFDQIGPLAELNSDEWESQPTIAPDGSFIVFSSIRDGGRGEKDLYIAVRRGDGTIAPPTNLGPRINSSDDDVSPFISADGSTLFFSSNRSGGFGGADIYVASRNAIGEWSEPRNLGALINTPANEYFFFGPGRRECYFASDRPGGKGGLDIYRAEPNIFAPGYSLLQVAVRDSVRGVGIPGRLKVVETSTGRTFGELDFDGTTAAGVPVLSGYEYRVQVTSRGFGDSTFMLRGFQDGRVIAQTINYGSVPPAPPPPDPVPDPTPIPPPPPERPTFARDLEGIDVPLFVSGYYRLNTPELLADLRERQSNGDLRERTYIADVARDQRAYNQYRTMATRVEKTIATFYSRGVNDYFPAYLEGREPDEHLEITVYGFADSRPILGIYSEAPVTFLDSNGRSVTVSTGDSLSNFTLAGLRARYAVDYLDKLFSTGPSDGGRDAYQKLKEQGLIRWRAVSGSVYQQGGADLSEQRRIRVEFRRIKGTTRLN